MIWMSSFFHLYTPSFHSSYILWEGTDLYSCYVYLSWLKYILPIQPILKAAAKSEFSIRGKNYILEPNIIGCSSSWKTTKERPIVTMTTSKTVLSASFLIYQIATQSRGKASRSNFSLGSIKRGSKLTKLTKIAQSRRHFNCSYRLKKTKRMQI